MPSDFYKEINADERKEWRQHPTTVMALQMLRDFREETERQIVDSSPKRTEGELKYDIGQAFGIKECIELLERE